MNDPENSVAELSDEGAFAATAAPATNADGDGGASTATSVDRSAVDDLFPVYAWSGDPDHPRRHLVMTPWMLLDCLKACQDDAYTLLVEVCRTGLGEETRYGVVRNPVADRLERINFGIAHILKVLWRGGIWTDADIQEAEAADGREYRVIREPFTIGKPGSLPLPADAPDWQRELLGIPIAPSPSPVTEQDSADHSATSSAVEPVA